METETSNILEVRDVVAGYGSVMVLDHVSVNVSVGEIVSIIGPNGAGKSTLLKVISRLLKPSSGQVVFDGSNTMGLQPYEMLSKGMCYVPQGRNIFPSLTIEENLRIATYVLKDKETLRRRIEQVYEKFPVLEEKKRQRARELSGGQQQMLEMAKALVFNPKLILFDEPSLALAPKIVESVFERIQELHKSGTTVLIVEQNAYRSLLISDRGYVLELGRNRFEGLASDLLANEQVRKLYLGG